jgi:hypothetical protein
MVTQTQFTGQDVYARTFDVDAQSGVMSVDEANAYADTLERASANGEFFASSNLYTMIARSAD